MFINQLYYILSGFFTLLIGIPLGLNPILLVLFYYLITKLIFKVLSKNPKELDNIQENIVNTLNLNAITTGIANFIKAVSDFIFNIIDILYLKPFGAIVNYSSKWIEWISSGKAGDYIVEFIMDTINFVIFQIQELINSGFEWANSKTGGIIPKLSIDLVDLPEEAYVLDDIF